MFTKTVLECSSTRLPTTIYPPRSLQKAPHYYSFVLNTAKVRPLTEDATGDPVNETL